MNYFLYLLIRVKIWIKKYFSYYFNSFFGYYKIGYYKVLQNKQNNKFVYFHVVKKNKMNWFVNIISTI